MHGQEFIGSFTPKEKFSCPDDYSISSHIRTPFEQPKGDWSEIREEEKHIVSTLSFHVSGFTFMGHSQIGGEGSGIFATFYEMSTPIDSQSTAMRYLFTRNFVAEPEHDEGYMARNMKNVNEDRVLAEERAFTTERPRPSYRPGRHHAQRVLGDPRSAERKRLSDRPGGTGTVGPRPPLLRDPFPRPPVQPHRLDP